MRKLKFHKLMLITSKWIINRDINFDTMIGHHLRINSAFSKFSRCLVIFKMAAKTWHKKWAVKIQHCPISSKFDMWVDNDVPN